MAIPLSPRQFNVQMGNSQIYLSWGIAIGATEYRVVRSTDGVNYTALSSPVTNSYLDTDVTVGTQYYYKVASFNTDGTSPYTNAQSMITASEGKLPLGNLRLMCQQKADMVNSNYVSLTEWNSFINQSYYELYDLLVTTYEDYYVGEPHEFSANGTDARYDLPDDLYKVTGVDLSLGSSAWISLKQFNFIDRNSYVYPQLTATALGVFNPRYRIVGNTLMFIPTPPGGQTYRVWYVPRLTQLLRDTDIVDGVSGWTQYIIVRAAKYALDKEESPTQALDQELLYLKERIQNSAPSRDAGQPSTISNTRSSFNNWGANGDGWDNGSWGGL